MAAPAEQEEFKWLASMDSESVIRTMKQLDNRKPAPTVSLAAGPRAPRKRTKSMKAVEAAESAAELGNLEEMPPSKRACPPAVNNNSASQAVQPTPSPPVANSAQVQNLDANQNVAPPSLFKPVDHPDPNALQPSTNIIAPVPPEEIPTVAEENHPPEWIKQEENAWNASTSPPDADVHGQLSELEQVTTASEPQPDHPAILEPNQATLEVAEPQPATVPLEVPPQPLHAPLAPPDEAVPQADTVEAPPEPTSEAIPVEAQPVLPSTDFPDSEVAKLQPNPLTDSGTAVPVPQVPVAIMAHHQPPVSAGTSNAAVPTAEMIFSQHMQQTAAANAANVLAAAPPAHVNGAIGADSDGGQAHMEAMPPSEASEVQTKYTGVRKNKGGRFSARIKLGGVNRYLGSFPTAEEAARAFDSMAIQNGRPVETLNFPAAYGGPTVGQAYRKRKVHKLYADPSHQINILLQKLADVDRSNPGILRLTMGTLGVPESRYLADNKYSGVRQQSSHWETRIRYKDKLYSMGFYASVEAAALAWDITAASLQRCRKLNFPEVSFADLEQQLDALKCVISQAVPASHVMQMPPPQISPPPPLPVPLAMDPDSGANLMEGHTDQVDSPGDLQVPGPSGSDDVAVPVHVPAVPPADESTMVPAPLVHSTVPAPQMPMNIDPESAATMMGEQTGTQPADVHMPDPSEEDNIPIAVPVPAVPPAHEASMVPAPLVHSSSPALQQLPMSMDPSMDPGVDPNVDPSMDPGAHGVDHIVDPNMDPSVNPSMNPSVDPNVDPSSDPSMNANNE